MPGRINALERVLEPDPLISVVTIAFNAAAFIEQAIQSVLAQTYPGLEYIIIDGGSSDGTVDIIRRHASRLAYWHSRPDRGLTHAFNLGLAQSRGKWLIFLNADDFFLTPAAVEQMVPHLLAHPEADVVFGRRIIMTREPAPRPVPLRQIGGHPWSWQEFRRYDTIPHPAAFTNRRFFARVGDFNERFRTVMDYELFLRAGRHLRARFVPVEVTGMRQGGASGLNLIRNLLEARQAIAANQALPEWLSWVNFTGRLGRVYWGRLAHRVLRPIAAELSLADRVPGRFAGK